jgi:S1-C subfamily serine protease
MRHTLRFLAALLVSCWALSPTHVRAQALDPLDALERHHQALFARTAPAVVFIANQQGFGSGFFVSSDGLILTNAHVVGSQKQVRVVLHDGRTLEGEVLRRAERDLDLALVRVAVQGAPTLAFADLSTLSVGSWVASVGHGRGAIWTFNVGFVSNIYPSGGERPVLQTQIPLNPGSSGGPVLDRHGRVVGVVTAGIKESNSINFAIKADVCQGAFAELRRAVTSLRVQAPQGVAVFVDGRHAGIGPKLIVPIDPTRSTPIEVMAVIGGRMVKRQVDGKTTHEITLESPAP